MRGAGGGSRGSEPRADCRRGRARAVRSWRGRQSRLFLPGISDGVFVLARSFGRVPGTVDGPVLERRRLGSGNSQADGSRDANAALAGCAVCSAAVRASQLVPLDEFRDSARKLSVAAKALLS